MHVTTYLRPDTVDRRGTYGWAWNISLDSRVHIDDPAGNGIVETAEETYRCKDAAYAAGHARLRELQGVQI